MEKGGPACGVSMPWRPCWWVPLGGTWCPVWAGTSPAPPAPYEMRRGPVHMRLSLRIRAPSLPIRSHPQHLPFINPDRAPPRRRHWTPPFYCNSPAHLEHHPSNPTTSSFASRFLSSPKPPKCLSRTVRLPADPRAATPSDVSLQYPVRQARDLHRATLHLPQPIYRNPTMRRVTNDPPSQQTSSPRRSPST